MTTAARRYRLRINGLAGEPPKVSATYDQVAAALDILRSGGVRCCADQEERDGHGNYTWVETTA